MEFIGKSASFVLVILSLQIYDPAAAVKIKCYSCEARRDFGNPDVQSGPCWDGTFNRTRVKTVDCNGRCFTNLAVDINPPYRDQVILRGCDSPWRSPCSNPEKDFRCYPVVTMCDEDLCNDGIPPKSAAPPMGFFLASCGLLMFSGIALLSV
ncbi:hypothetical protein BV898_13516 [Hypsibius exemplaris]|uniref:Protein quiver n=1 Tax=Hypsibius exemplaris TaxID=2072580 RepID=A0A1W0WAJ3_HYPEX|nr:hypothetical protein BV898_13516 [Hypsibius exemplaris]